jgi:moderate conductance mechanosensitive channel
MDILAVVNPFVTPLLVVLAEVVVLFLPLALLSRVIGKLLTLIQRSVSIQLSVALPYIRLFVTCAAALGFLAIMAGNGWLVYKKLDIPSYTLEKVSGISIDTWKALGLGFFKVLGLALVARWARKKTVRILELLSTKAQNYDAIKANDKSVAAFFVTLQRGVALLFWLAVVYVGCMLLGLPENIQETLGIAIRISMIGLAGALCWRTIDPIIISADALSQRYSNKFGVVAYYDRLHGLVPLFRTCVEAVIYVATASMVVAQLEPIAALASWGTRLIRVIGIFFAAKVTIEVMGLLCEEMLVHRPELTPEQKQVRISLVPLLRTVMGYLIYFGAGVMILKEVGINPMPILAGAGILGVAVGMGAQSLLSDILAGFSILFDNLFLIGDYIKVGEVEGIVESIDLSTTQIRDNSGRVVIIRNGKIEQVVNCSREYMKAVVDVGVSYEANLNTVYKALEEAGASAKESISDILEPLSILGIERFGSSEIVIKTSTKVKPGCHVAVERVLRRLIKERFDFYSIEIPYARQVVIVKQDAEHPLTGLLGHAEQLSPT